MRSLIKFANPLASLSQSPGKASGEVKKKKTCGNGRIMYNRKKKKKEKANKQAIGWILLSLGQKDRLLEDERTSIRLSSYMTWEWNGHMGSGR